MHWAGFYSFDNALLKAKVRRWAGTSAEFLVKKALLVLPHNITLSIEIDCPLDTLGLPTCGLACGLASGFRFTFFLLLPAGLFLLLLGLLGSNLFSSCSGGC